MKPLRGLQKLLGRVKGPVFVIVALITIGATVGGWALLPVRAEQPEALPILVDGETIWLELGKNVHQETYDLLMRDHAFASDPKVKWVFIDNLWVPLARAAFEQPKRAPRKERRPSHDIAQGIVGPEYIPECDISLSVPAYSQIDTAWKDDPLCGGCEKTIEQEGCAITATAMVFRYFGANTNPGQLNACASTHSCCSSLCELDGYCADEPCSGGRATFVGTYAFNWLDLCGLLSQNRPPQVHVGNHWVVVYKSRGYDLYSGGDYYLNDSIDGSTYKRLSFYPTPTETAEYRSN